MEIVKQSYSCRNTGQKDKIVYFLYDHQNDVARVGKAFLQCLNPVTRVDDTWSVLEA